MQENTSLSSNNSKWNKIIPTSGLDLIPGRSYHSALLYDHYIIFLSNQKDYTKYKSLLFFDLTTLAWNTITPRGESKLLNYYGYSVCAYSSKKIICCGGYLHHRNVRVDPDFDELIVDDFNEWDGYRTCLELLTISKPSSQDVDTTKSPLPFHMGWNEIQMSANLPFLQDHTANIYDNKMYIFGGLDFRQKINGLLYIVNLGSLESKITIHYQAPSAGFDEKSIAPRYKHCAMLYRDKIYYYGGLDQKGKYLYDMWVLNLRSLEWEEIEFRSLIPTPRAGGLVQISGDTLFFLGGNDELGMCRDLVSYKIGNNQWRRKKNEIMSPGAQNMFVIHQNKLIYGQDFKLYSLELGQADKSDEDEDQNFKASDRRFYNEKPFADVTFIVENQRIPAHKALLVARCTHFKNMFESGMKEARSQVIEVPEMKYDSFNKYIYCGEIQTLTEEVAIELLKLADKYLMAGLRILCERFLMNILTVENVIELTNLAEVYGATKLKEAGLVFMVENFDSVFEKYDIKSLPSEIILQLVKQKMR